MEGHAYLLRHMMSAGELGGCWNGGAVDLGLDEALDVMMASREGDGCAGCASPSAPSNAGFFCLFFFLVMLWDMQGEQQLAR